MNLNTISINDLSIPRPPGVSESLGSCQEDEGGDDAGDDDVDHVGHQPGDQHHPVAGLGPDGQAHVGGDQDHQPEVEAVRVEDGGHHHELRQGEGHQVQEEAHHGQEEHACSEE